LIVLVLAAFLFPARGVAQSGGSWQPLGPAGVISQNYGLVTGRITALALDPSDTTGNTLYVGTTGGGIWKSQNAGTSNTSEVVFTALTDALPAMSGALDASISIGALSVQPGGTGVILAGTGDPNDALDSYYGAGILRSSDNGRTWSLIPGTVDQKYLFAGESVAGIAWGTAAGGIQACGANAISSNVAVAAVSQAMEGTLVGALGAGGSYEGLYYSTDNGLSWCLAKITDGGGKDVQGPNDGFAIPDGSAATSVVWNPIRKLFIAAVRYHGYYQSADGITWTRIAAQPGVSSYTGTEPDLSTSWCPTIPGGTGSTACPIFRGTLAVNPQTGDTFAWTVDAYNQDQGIWQDQCAVSAGLCTNQTITFAQQWESQALETAPPQDITIRNGDYNLSLAAIPSGQETMLLAGANDLWQTTCPYSLGCRWRNTTNSTVGFCAQVGEYQHALEWNASNAQEIFIGNDGGLWRSTDAIGESGTNCAASDANHFQNLNGSLGSLGEVVSLSQTGETPYTMMASLGTIGTAGVNSSAGPTTDWPEILGGEGGPVAIDPVNPSNWYVNNGAGVSIYEGSPPTGSTPGAFAAVVNAATDPGTDVVKDGYTMYAPAPFLVDPADHTQLLIATCRVWRGPANGSGWSDANAISPILDGVTANATCNGDPQIRTIAALPLPVSASLPSGGEVVYVGMYGTANGGASLPGHIFSGTVNFAGSSTPTWSDLTLNPVSNDTRAINFYGMDITSIAIDPHDATGKTVYVAVAGFSALSAKIQTVYGSTDGGAHWASLMSNLPAAPANSLVVDPLDANTVYLATDAGVYSTRAISTCANVAASCWSPFGSGLPPSPVVQISAAPATAAMHDLVAGTYGRGVWEIPLWTAVEDMTTATTLPASLTFASQAFGSTSNPQTVTVKNTGSHTLSTYLSTSGDFTASGSCEGGTVQPGQSCTVQVSFTPSASGTRTGVLTIYSNVAGGELTVALSGTGAPAGAVNASPSSINFNGTGNGVMVGQVSAHFSVTVSNSSSSAVSFSDTISGPFSIATNACGSSVPAVGSCNLSLIFSPTQSGAATGTLTINYAGGTQAVALSGTGILVSVTPSAINFNGSTSGVSIGQNSPAFQVTASNSGPVALPVSVGISGPFSIATNSCGSAIPAVGSCNLTLIFTPSQPGEASGTLTLTDAAGTQTVALSGTGLAAATDILSVAALTFPNTVIGHLSPAQTVLLSNSGGVALTSISIFTSGTNAADFQVTNPCTANLAAGSNCAISVQFAPSVAGPELATLNIASSAADSPKTVALSGTGIIAPTLGVSPSSLNFTGLIVGQASAPQTVTVTNTGTVPLNNVGFQINTISGGVFSCSPNACGASSCPSLAGGASCTVQIVFTPTTAGGSSASLVVSSSNSTPNQVTVPLTGGGQVLSGLNVSPALVFFPVTTAGQSSMAQTVTISNTSSSAANALTLTVLPPFALVLNSCGVTLAAGSSCTTGVIFAPAVNGNYTGNLTVSSSSLAASANVALSGNGGVPGSVSFQPSLLDFMQTGVGQTSGIDTVTLTNPDYVNSLGDLSLAVTAGFQLAATTCTTTLDPGASCTASIAFAPTSAGAQTGGLTVTSSALPTGAFLPLAGVGFDFTFVSSGSASQTISNGQVADFTLLIQPLSGSRGVFTFQCGSLPPSTSCTFNPTSENVPPNTTGNVVVEISTGLTQTNARSAPSSPWRALPLLCGLALLPFALRKRRRVLLTVALLAALVGGFSSCTLSNGGLTTTTGISKTTNGTTPPATYKVVVTATSNGVSHPITLTFTVD
jgi:hypothetical protein